MRKVNYTVEAIEFWLKQLATDWEPLLKPEWILRGRSAYRQNLVSTLELHVGYAIVQSASKESTVIEWNKNVLELQTSSEDREAGMTLGVAGIYEIEAIVAEVASPFPFEGAIAEPKREIVPIKPQSLPVKKNLVLEFFLKPPKFGFRVFWNEANITASLQDVLRQRSHFQVIDREQIVRLMYLAKQQWFALKDNAFVLENLAAIPDFLNRVVPKWKKYFVIKISDDILPLKQGVRELSMTMRAFLEKDGSLSLKATFDDGVEVPEEWLRHANKTQLMEGGRLIALRPKNLESFKRFREVLKNGHGKPYLLFSLVNAENLVLDEPLAQWKEALLKTPQELPGQTCLRPYQRDGVAWMRHLLKQGCSPLLADEMGLGKTLQVLALLDLETETEQELPDLVVCPASVVSVWEAEIRRFFPNRRVQKFSQAIDQTSLWIASYSQLRYHREILKTQKFRYAILDEAQMMKNPLSKTAQACFAIDAQNRLALTGTPIENKDLDFWSIMHFLMPGLLGSRSQFQEIVKTLPLSAIRAQLAPFFLRRTKAAVAKELPPKIEMELPCPLLEEQANLYHYWSERAFADFKEKGLSSHERFHFLALLMKLRLICCDPDLLRPQLSHEPKSGKIVVLLEKLAACFANQSKVVIFSQFVKLLKNIEFWIKKQWPDRPILLLTGESRQRGRLVEQFQSTEQAIMLVSLRAGGTGITLHSADTVFIVDPWWNPAVEDQAIDRVHRIGQSNPVSVYRLIASQTVEEAIQSLKSKKKALFHCLISGDSSVNFGDKLQELLSWVGKR